MTVLEQIEKLLADADGQLLTYTKSRQQAESLLRSTLRNHAAVLLVAVRTAKIVDAVVGADPACQRLGEVSMRSLLALREALARLEAEVE